MSFAGNVLKTVFGWFASLCSTVWGWISGSGGNGLISFLTDHWKTVILVISAAALVIDFVVYLFRWRPYRVWGSFFRRIFSPAPDAWDGAAPDGEDAPDGTPTAGAVPLWPADAAYGEPYAAQEPQAPYPFPAAPGPVSAPSYAADRFVSAQPAPPQEYRDSRLAVGAPSDQPAHARVAAKSPSGFSSPFSAIGLADDTGPHLRYVPPATAVNKDDAYMEPYIPPQWQEPGNTGTAYVRHRRSGG